MAMKTILKQPEKIAQRDPGEQDGLAITVESRPRLHVWSVRDHTGRETAPRGIGFRDQALKTIWTEGAQESPHNLPS